jgi:hypothetical protein
LTLHSGLQHLEAVGHIVATPFGGVAVVVLAEWIDANKCNTGNISTSLYLSAPGAIEGILYFEDNATTRAGN